MDHNPPSTQLSVQYCARSSEPGQCTLDVVFCQDLAASAQSIFMKESVVNADQALQNGMENLEQTARSIDFRRIVFLRVQELLAATPSEVSMEAAAVAIPEAPPGWYQIRAHESSGGNLTRLMDTVNSLNDEEQQILVETSYPSFCLQQAIEEKLLALTSTAFGDTVQCSGYVSSWNQQAFKHEVYRHQAKMHHVSISIPEVFDTSTSEPIRGLHTTQPYSADSFDRPGAILLCNAFSKVDLNGKTTYMLRMQVKPNMTASKDQRESIKDAATRFFQYIDDATVVDARAVRQDFEIMYGPDFRPRDPSGPTDPSLTVPAGLVTDIRQALSSRASLQFVHRVGVMDWRGFRLDTTSGSGKSHAIIKDLEFV